MNFLLTFFFFTFNQLNYIDFISFQRLDLGLVSCRETTKYGFVAFATVSLIQWKKPTGDKWPFSHTHSQIGACTSFLGGIAPPSSSITPSHLIVTKQIAIPAVCISLSPSNKPMKTLSPPSIAYACSLCYGGFCIMGKLNLKKDCVSFANIKGSVQLFQAKLIVKGIV